MISSTMNESISNETPNNILKVKEIELSKKSIKQIKIFRSHFLEKIQLI